MSEWFIVYYAVSGIISFLLALCTICTGELKEQDSYNMTVEIIGETRTHVLLLFFMLVFGFILLPYEVVMTFYDAFTGKRED